MVGCSIRNCKNRSEKGGTVRFFSFPQKQSVAKEWLLYCGSHTNTKYGRVCSEHFPASDYINPLQHSPTVKMPKHVRHLKPDAIPILKIDNIDSKKSKKLKDNGETTRTTTIGGSPGNNISRDSIYSSDSDNLSNECHDNVQVLLDFDAENSESMKHAYAAAADKIAGETGETNMYVVNVDHLSKTTNEISEDIENSDGGTELDDDSDRISHTTEAEIISSPSNNIEIRNNEVTIPVSEYKLLKEKYNEYHVLMHNLEQIFTPGQIRCLADPYRHRVQWSAEDITAAIKLRKISAASYRHLRATVGIPLPGFSTLRRWAAKHGVDISEPSVAES